MTDPTARETRPKTTLITVVVIGAMAIGPFINYVFSALGPFLVSRTRISSGDVGMIVTVIFGIATVGSARAGTVVDRRGPVWSSKLLLWLAVCALLTIMVADALVIFLVGAVLAGFVHALSHPATNALVSVHIPSERQGLVVGLKQSGVQVGQVIAGVLPLAAPIIGWRFSLSTGFVLIGVSLLGVHMVRSPLAAVGSPLPEPAGRPDRAATRLALYAVILGIASQGTNVYISLFAFEELRFPETTAGLMVGVVGAAGVVARIGWGVWVHRFTTMWRPLGVIALLMVASISLFWTSMALGAAFFIAGMALLSISATAVSVLLSMAVIQAPKKTDIGVNSGVVMRGLYAGYMVGPFLFGQIVSTVGYAVAWSVMAVFAVGAAITAGTTLRRLAV